MSHLQAPVDVMTVFIRGKVKLRIPARTPSSESQQLTQRDQGLTKRIVDADCPGHSLFTLNGGEHLGGVLERNRSFTQGIADCEQVDEPVMPS